MITKSEFNQIQQQIVSAWHCGNFPEAFAAIDRVLKNGNAEMKGTCLFYRAMIQESRGDWESVRQDCLKGMKYAKPGFLRYQLEQMMGTYYEQQRIPEEAIKWYRRALVTCDEGDQFSGHKSLVSFIRLSGQELSQTDERLVAKVTSKAWRVLGVPGNPDLSNLPATIGKLSEHFSKLVTTITEDN